MTRNVRTTAVQTDPETQDVGTIAGQLPYTAIVKTANGISFGHSVKIVEGWCGVLLVGDTEIESGPGRYGPRAKSAARLDGQNIKRRYEHHLRTTGVRLEVQRREKGAALRQAREASATRRAEFRADRLTLWRALDNLLDRELFVGDAAAVRARELVEKHRQAVLDIMNDPENRRGGDIERPLPTHVLAGGRRRKSS